jgi:hypothetical protein
VRYIVDIFDENGIALKADFSLLAEAMLKLDRNVGRIIREMHDVAAYAFRSGKAAGMKSRGARPSGGEGPAKHQSQPQGQLPRGVKAELEAKTKREWFDIAQRALHAQLVGAKTADPTQGF